MAGHHNVLNALAAVAVARELGVDEAAIRKGLAEFGGVKRRFTTTGVANGVRVVDDYGHHPVEIASVLKAARAVTDGQGDRRGPAAPLHAPARPVRRVLRLLQRRRHGDRGRRLCRPARRRSRASSRDALVEGLRRYGHRRVLPLDGAADLAGAGRARRPAAATWWCCWAPATSPPGPTPCRASWRRWARRRMSWRDAPAGGPRQAAARRAARRPSPGSGSAGRRSCCSCRRTRTTWPTSCRA